MMGKSEYKYGHHEQVTVRNHNGSTALERPVLKLGCLNQFYGGIPTSPSAFVMAQNIQL